MSAPKWNNVTLIGCGLIGASFALAIRRSGACTRIAGWDSNAQVLDEALRAGVIDEIDGAFATGEVSNAELIYLAMPVRQIINFLKTRGQQTRAGVIITDSGSTKAQICRAAQEHLSQDRYFIGGHPIAGSHNSGLAHAQANIFRGAPYILIDEGREGLNNALQAVKATLECLGSRVILITPSEHDRAMALLSHLPQLLSSALATAANEHTATSSWMQIAGPGYADMTRLAASSWAVWHDVFATNAEPLAGVLDLYITKLEAVRDELRLRAAGGDGDLDGIRALFRDSPGKSLKPS